MTESHRDEDMSVSVSIVTTCKGRLSFLTRTLPAMLDTGLPVTVVDFDCPDGTRRFLADKFPSVLVAAVDDQPLFNLALARNIGAQNSTGEMILFLDCDVMVSRSLTKFLDETEFSGAEFFRYGLTGTGLAGQCLVPRRSFERTGGYDEVITGWGWEDVDLYQRLRLRDLEERTFPDGLMSALPHSDALRVQFMDSANKWAGHRLNAIYSGVKVDIEGALRRSLSVAERQRLRRTIVDVASGLNASPKSISFTVPLPSVQGTRAVADAFYSLNRTLTYELKLGS